MLILRTTHLDISFDHSFSFTRLCLFYVSACGLVFICCLFMCVSRG